MKRINFSPIIFKRNKLKEPRKYSPAWYDVRAMRRKKLK